MAGRTLTIDINTQDAQTLAALKRLQREFKGLDTSIDKPRRTGLSLGNALGGLAIGVGLRKAVTEFEEAEVSARATEAVIKSTGNAAQVSAKQQDELVASLSRLAGIDDEIVNGGANMLRTFTSIKDENFGEALAASLDLAAFKGQDLASTAEQVGKALNDPLAGMSKLAKQGVVLSSVQKQQIRDFTAVGDTASAQKVILDELATEYGGQAEAAATASGRMKVAFDDAAESAGAILAPAMEKGASAVGFLSGQFQGISQPVQTAYLALGAAALASDRLSGKLGDRGLGGTLRANVGDLGAVNTALGAAAAGLTAFTVTTQLLEAASRSGADVSDLGTDLEAYAKGAATADQATKEIGGSVEDLAESFAIAFDNSGYGDRAGSVFGYLQPGAVDSGDIRNAENDIKALDEALAGMVESGNTEAATKAYGLLSQELIDAGVDIEDIARFLPEYTEAQDRAARSTRDTGSATEETAGKVRSSTQVWYDHVAALGKVDEATRTLLGQAFDEYHANEQYEQSVSGVTEATAELTLIRKKGDPKEIRAAEEKLSDAIAAQTEAKGKQAEATALANGKQLTAAEVAKVQKDELERLRETTGLYNDDLNLLVWRLAQVEAKARDARTELSKLEAQQRNDEQNGSASLPGTPGNPLAPTRDPDARVGGSRTLGAAPRAITDGVTIHAPNLTSVEPSSPQLRIALGQASRRRNQDLSVMTG